MEKKKRRKNKYENRNKPESMYLCIKLQEKILWTKFVKKPARKEYWKHECQKCSQQLKMNSY